MICSYQNHVFVDGNKRTGMLAMLTFLELSGAEREYTDEEIISVGMDVATGIMDDKALLCWIIK